MIINFTAKRRSSFIHPKYGKQTINVLKFKIINVAKTVYVYNTEYKKYVKMKVEE